MEETVEQQDKAAAVPGRWWVWATALSSFPAILLSDAAIAWLRGWSRMGLTPDEKAYLVLLFACAALPFALSAIPAVRRILSVAGPKITAIAVSVVMAAVAGELFFRATGAGDRFHRRPAGFRMKLAPDPKIMPGIEGPESSYTINEIGVRGKTPPDRTQARRVLCIGGSTTECLYLDDSETWPALLETMLNKRGKGECWVGDVGIAGFDSGHHKALLQDTRFISQFDVLVFLAGVNDMSRFVRGLPPGDFSVAPTWKKSILLRKIKDRFWPSGPIMGATGAFHETLRERRRNAKISESAPDLPEGLAIFESNLTAIAENCRAAGKACVFLTQPVLWKKDLPKKAADLCWNGDARDGAFLSIEDLAAGMAKYNAKMIATAKACGVHCIDLSSMNGSEAFFYDDCHYTEAGAREVARLVAENWPE